MNSSTRNGTIFILTLFLHQACAGAPLPTPQRSCKNTFNAIPEDSRYPEYPQRAPVPAKYRDWRVVYPGYKPVTMPPSVIETVEKDSKAHGNWRAPEISAAEQEQYENPCGRTGIGDRGILGKWGENKAADPIITRYDPETGKLLVLLIRRGDSKTGVWALPGGMVDPTDKRVSAAASRELFEETGLTINMDDAQQVYADPTVFVDDPRNTDRAWMVTTVFHKHLDNNMSQKIQKKPLKPEDANEIKGIQWVAYDELDKNGKKIIDNLYASHSTFLQDALFNLKKSGKFLEVRSFAKEESSGKKIPATKEKDTAVIVIDVQADFTTYKNGTLAVPDSGEDYVQKVILAVKKLKLAGYPIEATQDWHPKNHTSFAANHIDKATGKSKEVFKPMDITIPVYDKTGKKIVGQRVVSQMLWPVHCVQNTPGAALLVPRFYFDAVVQKGMSPDADSYSGFKDDSGKATGLNDILKKSGIKNLVIFGIATDYCVQATVLHGLELGYNVAVILDLCRGVTEETSKAAENTMREKGAIIYHTLDQFLQKKDKWQQT